MPAPLASRDEAARCEALRRVLRLYVALACGPRGLPSLASELRVSGRTVRRDMDVLRGVGVSIWRNETSGQWHLADHGIFATLRGASARTVGARLTPVDRRQACGSA